MEVLVEDLGRAMSEPMALSEVETAVLTEGMEKAIRTAERLESELVSTLQQDSTGYCMAAEAAVP